MSKKKISKLGVVPVDFHERRRITAEAKKAAAYGRVDEFSSDKYGENKVYNPTVRKMWVLLRCYPEITKAEIAEVLGTKQADNTRVFKREMGIGIEAGADSAKAERRTNKISLNGPLYQPEPERLEICMPLLVKYIREALAEEPLISDAGLAQKFGWPDDKTLRADCERLGSMKLSDLRKTWNHPARDLDRS